MSNKQIGELVRLDPGKFDPRTHAALAYVRAFLTEPDGVPEDVKERFEAEYEPGERTQVLAAMKVMFCVNLLVNMRRWVVARMTGRPLDTGKEVCRL